MSYGDFDFWPLRALAGATEKRKHMQADGLLSGGLNGCLKSDGPLSGDGRLVFGMGKADAVIPGSVVAAGFVIDEPCRVTTPVSRMSLRRMAARGAGNGVPGSR
jgi:hypothetical protein